MSEQAEKQVKCDRCKDEGEYLMCADDCVSPWCIDPYFDCSPQFIECDHKKDMPEQEKA